MPKLAPSKVFEGVFGALRQEPLDQWSGITPCWPATRDTQAKCPAKPFIMRMKSLSVALSDYTGQTYAH